MAQKKSKRQLMTIPILVSLAFLLGWWIGSEPRRQEILLGQAEEACMGTSPSVYLIESCEDSYIEAVSKHLWSRHWWETWKEPIIEPKEAVKP